MRGRWDSDDSFCSTVEVLQSSHTAHDAKGEQLDVDRSEDARGRVCMIYCQVPLQKRKQREVSAEGLAFGEEREWSFLALVPSLGRLRCGIGFAINGPTLTFGKKSF